MHIADTVWPDQAQHADWEQCSVTKSDQPDTLQQFIAVAGTWLAFLMLTSKCSTSVVHIRDITTIVHQT